MEGNALFTTGQIAVYSFSWPKRSDHRSDLNSSDFVNLGYTPSYSRVQSFYRAVSSKNSIRLDFEQLRGDSLACAGLTHALLSVLVDLL